MWVVHIGLLCLITRMGYCTLIYRSPTSVAQAVMGAGLPVDLRDETVIVGGVFKASYALPKNASDILRPNTYFVRRKRELAPVVPTRWDIYHIIGAYAKMYRFGGNDCVLRTICDVADSPLDKSGGIFEEIIHVLFKPTTTNEAVKDNTDNEYYAAQEMGRTHKGRCSNFFPDCKISFIDVFSYLT